MTHTFAGCPTDCCCCFTVFVASVSSGPLLPMPARKVGTLNTAAIAPAGAPMRRPGIRLGQRWREYARRR